MSLPITISSRKHFLRRQSGMTLVEFMVGIVLGMILVAALAALIANQSQSRSEIDKSGRLIENGRFAMQQIVNDVMMAGYWGELGALPKDMTVAAYPGLPDPCSTATAVLYNAALLHVQGYDAPTTLPTELGVCVRNHRPGTDIIVVRRLDADFSDLQTAGVVDWAKLKAGQIYMQTGLASGELKAKVAMADGTSDLSTFTYTKKDKTTKVTPRRYLVHIYYIAKCSVESSGSCTNADGGSPIPTLKRVELTASGGSPVFTTTTIAEGIENMQIDYLTYDGAGVPAGADVNGSALTKDTWQDVLSMKVYLVARSAEAIPGFTDNKSYSLGSAGAASAPTGEQNFRRHVFVQSVRTVNPLGRRVL